jgi:hypothetical protein
MVLAIPALWVSGRILLRNPIATDRVTQVFLWLVLGGFFTIPLVDILSNIGNLVIANLQADQPDLPVRIGTTSLMWNLIIYAVGIYLGQRAMTRLGVPFIKELALTPFERSFMVLGLAGLFNHAVSGILINLMLRVFTPGTIN